VRPELVIDLHTPLECVLAFSDDAVAVAEHLAEPASLPVRRELDAPTNGDSASWCEQAGATAVTYELELAPLPELWARHVDAVTRMLVERR
jgi:hypothetical protein